MDLELQNKIALITGSSRGLGFATAMQLAREGAKVAINGRSPESLESAARSIRSETGAEILAIAADVTDQDVPARIVQRVIDAWGGLDILITNTGGPPAGSFESFNEADWQKAVNLSFFAHVRLIRAALPWLRKSSVPSVLTITSSSTKQPIPNLILSNSIRLATIGLTKSLAIEMGSQGIRFNSILPSWTETERVDELMRHRAEKNGTQVEDEIRKQAQAAALGRLGKPEEFAKSAAFMVSPAASYLTGVMLSFDGGSYRGTF